MSRTKLMGHSVLGKRRLQAWSERWEILSDRENEYERTQTIHVGGGGHVGPHGGYVSAPTPVTISHGTTHERQIWVRDCNSGVEDRKDISGVRLPLRAGHHLDAVTANVVTPRGTLVASCLYLRNRETTQGCWVKDPSAVARAVAGLGILWLLVACVAGFFAYVSYLQLSDSYESGRLAPVIKDPAGAAKVVWMAVQDIPADDGCRLPSVTPFCETYTLGSGADRELHYYYRVPVERLLLMAATPPLALFALWRFIAGFGRRARIRELLTQEVGILLSAVSSAPAKQR